MKQERSVEESYLLGRYGCFLTIDAVAEILQVNRATVDKLTHAGQLPYARVGAQYRIRVTDLLAYIDADVKRNQRELLESSFSRR